jgi:hypothetical protein
VVQAKALVSTFVRVNETALKGILQKARGEVLQVTLKNFEKFGIVRVSRAASQIQGNGRSR